MVQGRVLDRGAWQTIVHRVANRHDWATNTSLHVYLCFPSAFPAWDFQDFASVASSPSVVLKNSCPWDLQILFILPFSLPLGLQMHLYQIFKIVPWLMGALLHLLCLFSFTLCASVWIISNYHCSSSLFLHLVVSSLLKSPSEEFIISNIVFFLLPA